MGSYRILIDVIFNIYRTLVYELLRVVYTMLTVVDVVGSVVVLLSTAWLSALSKEKRRTLRHPCLWHEWHRLQELLLSNA